MTKYIIVGLAMIGASWALAAFLGGAIAKGGTGRQPTETTDDTDADKSWSIR